MTLNEISDTNFSIGTQPIVNTLLSLVNSDNPPDTVVVNVDTIIRNCVSKNYNSNQEERIFITVDDLVKFSSVEILNLLTELVNMYRDRLSAILNPTIIVYLGKYEKYIPENQRRKMNQTKNVINQAAQIINQSVLTRMEECNRGIRIIQIPTNNGLPYRAIANEIHEIQNQHKVVLISHHPLDYYLYLFCTDMIIIHSFTGKISKPNTFGKIVFDNDDLPFYPAIHALFGDTTDIVSSLSLKDKRKLKEIAKTESWITMDFKQISNRLYELGIRVPFTI